MIFHYLFPIAHCVILTSPLSAERASPIWSLRFSPDGQTLAVGIHQQVLLIETENWKVRGSLPDFMDSVRCLRYSRDGKLLMVGGGYPKEIGEVVIFQTSDLEYIGGSEHHVDVVEDLVPHPGGKKYVTVSMDHSAIITDQAEGEILKILKHKDRVYAAAVSPDGKFVITGGADNVLRVWNMKGELVTSVQQQRLAVRGIRFLSGGTEFLASQEDGRLSRWALRQTGNDKWGLNRLKSEKAHGEYAVHSLALLPATNRALSAGADGRCVLWNTDRLKQIREILSDADQLYAVAASPDGALAAAGGRSGRLHVFSLMDGSLVKTLVPPAPKMEEMEEE
jgi:WD40 repeat protein